MTDASDDRAAARDYALYELALDLLRDRFCEADSEAVNRFFDERLSVIATEIAPASDADSDGGEDGTSSHFDVVDTLVSEETVDLLEDLREEVLDGLSHDRRVV